MDQVVINEDESITVIAEDTVPNSVTVDEAGTTSVVSVTAEGEKVVVASESSPDLLMITSGGSAYVSAVNEGFVGTEVEWLYEVIDGRASVTYVNNMWAQLDDDITAQNTELRQVITDTEFSLSQNISNLSVTFDQDISALNNELRQVITTETTALSQSQSVLEASVANDITALNNQLNTAYTDLNESVAQNMTNLETQFQDTFATVEELTTSISNSETAMAEQRSLLEASINDNISSQIATVNQAITTEEIARASAVQSLQASIDGNQTASISRFDQVETDVNGNALAISSVEGKVNDPINNNSALYSFVQQAQSTADGNTSSITNLQTQVTNNADNISSAELTLSSHTDELGVLSSRAYLGVTNTVNGVSTVTGLTIGGTTNAIRFQGDIFELYNTAGDPKLYWDTVDENKLVINAKLVLDDGHTINNLGDIRAQDGAGFYGGTWSSISWTTSTANTRLESLAGRPPTNGDILVQNTTGGASDARKYNGSSWVSPGLLLNGDLIATGTIAGDRIVAGTSITSPVINTGTLNTPTVRGGKVEMVGTGFMKVQAADSFGPNNLIEWYGPKNTNTYDSNGPRYGNLTKANAITYLDDTGGAYFGGSIIAGTLKNAVQTTTKVYDPFVETGPYGSNGNTIEIKCSISVSTANQDGGTCPTDPPTPQATLRLIRLSPNGTVEVASHVVTGDYTCFIEGSNPSGSERYQTWTLSGSFTFTDNINTTQDRNYRLEADITDVGYLTFNNNSSLNLSLISEEA